MMYDRILHLTTVVAIVMTVWARSAVTHRVFSAWLHALRGEGCASGWGLPSRHFRHLQSGQWRGGNGQCHVALIRTLAPPKRLGDLFCRNMMCKRDRKCDFYVMETTWLLWHSHWRVTGTVFLMIKSKQMWAIYALCSVSTIAATAKMKTVIKFQSFGSLAVS